jgi:hypothetical protein
MFITTAWELELEISFTRICEENYSRNPKLRTFNSEKLAFFNCMVCSFTGSLLQTGTDIDIGCSLFLP